MLKDLFILLENGTCVSFMESLVPNQKIRSA